MSPRFMGARAVIARSFARIAETNLKKQGLLALTFDDPAAWELIQEQDRLSLSGLDELGPHSKLVVSVAHADGSTDSFMANHTLSPLQVEWFRAGSALNHLREQNDAV